MDTTEIATKATAEGWDAGRLQRAIIGVAMRAATAARADEREACAKIAHEHSAFTRSFGAEEACEMIEKAIRARGEG